MQIILNVDPLSNIIQLIFNLIIILFISQGFSLRYEEY
jgi:hypothetical protein